MHVGEPKLFALQDLDHAIRTGVKWLIRGPFPLAGHRKASVVAHHEHFQQVSGV